MFSPILRRHIIALLCLKAAALTLLYFLFFSHKPAVTPAAMQQQLSRPHFDLSRFRTENRSTLFLEPL